MSECEGHGGINILDTVKRWDGSYLEDTWCSLRDVAGDKGDSVRVDVNEHGHITAIWVGGHFRECEGCYDVYPECTMIEGDDYDRFHCTDCAPEPEDEEDDDGLWDD